MSKIKDLVTDELNDAADIIALSEAIENLAAELRQKVNAFRLKYGYHKRGSNDTPAS